MGTLTSIVGGTALAAAGFVGGCLYKHETINTGQYALQEEQGLVYVINKESGERQPLTSTFQLGSPAYRLKGLLIGEDRDTVVSMIAESAERQLLNEVTVNANKTAKKEE